MSHTRSMTIVEKNGKWTNAVKSVFGSQIDICRLSPHEVSECVEQDSGLIAMEASREAIGNWLTVFDKNGATAQNQCLVLMAAPHDRLRRDWFRELGFVEFVSRITDLERISRLLEVTARPLKALHLHDEFILRLPWRA